MTGAEKGAWVYAREADSWEHRPAIPTHVVDPTGAGDAFVGTLVAELALDKPLGSALDSAIRSGAQAVSTKGARLPLPSREMGDHHLGKHDVRVVVIGGDLPVRLSRRHGGLDRLSGSRRSAGGRGGGSVDGGGCRSRRGVFLLRTGGSQAGRVQINPAQQLSVKRHHNR